MNIPSTLQSAKQYIKQALHQRLDPIVVDATLGNGNDTLFLAQEVGIAGRVYGFDIQSLAIEKTIQRLAKQGFLDRVILFQAGHEQWETLIPLEHKYQIQAIMFNLGYLPHGDETIITRPETTLQAIQHACEWLAPGGVITIALYTGHEGGQDEANHVVTYVSQLPSKQFQVIWQRVLNRTQAPSLVVIKKKQLNK